MHAWCFGGILCKQRERGREQANSSKQEREREPLAELTVGRQYITRVVPAGVFRSWFRKVFLDDLGGEELQAHSGNTLTNPNPTVSRERLGGSPSGRVGGPNWRRGRGTSKCKTSPRQWGAPVAPSNPRCGEQVIVWARQEKHKTVFSSQAEAKHRTEKTAAGGRRTEPRCRQDGHPRLSVRVVVQWCLRLWCLLALEP